MGKIFYIMGKSATGKDTILKELLEKRELGLKKAILYTTRPIRAKERDGVEYHFVNEDELKEFQRSGKVIELRAYHTIHGVWKYFTVDDGQFGAENQNYLAIGTLESFGKMKHYFGEDIVEPLYIEAADDMRLERALRREKKQALPKYEELCRRFLADASDFSEENLKKANIERRFRNDNDREHCIEEITDHIMGVVHRQFIQHVEKC